MSRPANSRDSLLDAAEEIVREDGAAHLSFNAISARAGVSKGGLLYHFPTKEALLQALLQRVSLALSDARQAESAKLPESATRELRAHILSAARFQSRRLQGVGFALMAAGAHDSKLLAPAREGLKALIEEIHAPALPLAFTTIIALALEGLWALEIVGIFAPSSEERQEIMGELIRLVDDAEARTLKWGARGAGQPGEEPEATSNVSGSRNDNEQKRTTESCPEVEA